MLAKLIFRDCKEYSWNQFKSDFRVVTADNVNLVARMYGWRGAKDMYYDTRVDIIGEYVALAADEVYGEQGIDNVLQAMVDACKELRRTEENIHDYVLYESIGIFWCTPEGGSNAVRVYPHTILEYMEFEGEGDIQLTQADEQAVFNSSYTLSEILGHEILILDC